MDGDGAVGQLLYRLHDCALRDGPPAALYSRAHALGNRSIPPSMVFHFAPQKSMVSITSSGKLFWNWFLAEPMTST